VSARETKEGLILKRDKKQRSTPAVLDLFCGAGGMSLGFKNAGCRILGGIDQNKYAIATHHQNFPNLKLTLKAQDNCRIKVLIGVHYPYIYQTF